MSDGHAGGDAVRIDDEIRDDAIDRPRHVFLPEIHADGALLSMSGRKFVSNFWNPNLPCSNFSNFPVSKVGGDDGSIDVAKLRPPRADGGIKYFRRSIIAQDLVE